MVNNSQSAYSLVHMNFEMKEMVGSIITYSARHHFPHLILWRVHSKFMQVDLKIGILDIVVFKIT